MKKETDAQRDRRLTALMFKGVPVPDGIPLPHLSPPVAVSTREGIARANAEIQALKQASYSSWVSGPPDLSVHIASRGPSGKWADIAEFGKLAVLDNWVGWEGVSFHDRAKALIANLDVSKLPDDVRSALGRAADPPVPLPTKGPVRVTFAGHECTLRFRTYGNGRTSLELLDGSGRDSVAIATINVPDAPLGPNQVLIKDYSENQGMLAALEKAGVVRPTGVLIQAGYATAPVCDLLISPTGPEKQPPAKRPRSRDMDRG